MCRTARIAARPVFRQLLDRRAAQRGDPVEPGRAQRLLDPRAGQHAAVADQDHVAQPEALLQLGDLGGDGGWIGGVAFEHLDRHRTTIRGTQQADHQLRPVAAAVAAVAVAGQRTAAALEIGGGDVVEHQCAVLEMTACELVFDERLLAAEPVEGGVDLAGGDAAEAKGFAQRVAGGGGVEHARGGQFGRRIEQPGDDERQRQVAAALGRAAGQQLVEADAPATASAARTWPCGSERRISKPFSPIGASGSPRSAARRVSMRSIGSLERLARVRFLTLPSSR